MVSTTLLETIFNSYTPWILLWNKNKEQNSFEPEAHQSLADSEPLLNIIYELHRFNYLLWNQEDIARRTDVAESVIVSVKRNIDKYNQQRNDRIEQVDEWLLINHYGHLLNADLPIRTETPGSVFDRLSILSLKIFHMQKQTERTDVEQEHIIKCEQRLQTLQLQRSDLQKALMLMFRDLNEEKLKMKIYRQFKMYNDPTMNPQLYMNASQK